MYISCHSFRALNRVRLKNGVVVFPVTVSQEELENIMADCPPKGSGVSLVGEMKVIFTPVYPATGFQSFYSGSG